MARKVVNRKEKAAEIEAAAAQEKAAPKKRTTKASGVAGAPKKKVTRKAKVVEEPRKKLYWGVFSQNLKRVAVFEFDQKDEAASRAEELSKGGKSPHFIQKVKEEIQLE
ncbi:MAG: hypothetical protein EA381_11390 [Planctomycetaceae bacterium]|jgi:hypothetical protein|nr:MAG: hypothetical protein EA381_11390 [Planctomycetaceae bacterium]